MSLPAYTRNSALGAILPNTLSLHSDFPGTSTGSSNELIGGSPAYARKAVSMNAIANGTSSSAATVTFDVPSGSTVSWVGAFAGSNYLAPMPLGGSTPRNFSAILSSDQIVSTAHGFSAGQTVVFYDGVPPGGLTEGTIYYVRDVGADAFCVASTVSGAAINLTSGPSFGCVVNTITVKTFSVQSTQDVSLVTAAVPS